MLYARRLPPWGAPVRTGRACANSDLRLGPPTVVGGQRRKPNRTCRERPQPVEPATGRAPGGKAVRAVEGGQRCGKKAPAGTRCSCYGCSGDSCCGRRHGRCDDRCSTTRPAPPARLVARRPRRPITAAGGGEIAMVGVGWQAAGGGRRLPLPILSGDRAPRGEGQGNGHDHSHDHNERQRHCRYAAPAASGSGELGEEITSRNP